MFSRNASYFQESCFFCRHFEIIPLFCPLFGPKMPAFSKKMPAFGGGHLASLLSTGIVPDLYRWNIIYSWDFPFINSPKMFEEPKLEIPL
jgi:hypothetical protein